MVKKRKTAAEHGAELEADPAFVRRQREQEDRVRQHLEEMYRAEAPVVEALSEAGVRVKTVWDLVNTRAQYPNALPILWQHLQEPYPDIVLRGIAGALAVPEAIQWWDSVVELFQARQGERVNGVKTALAAVLSAAADDHHVGDVIRLVDDPSHGEHRLVLLNVLARSARPEAQAALERAAQDPQLMKEAKIQLRFLARRKRKGILQSGTD